MYFYPPEQEDTPRTYRSDASNAPAIPKHTQKEIDNVIISTKEITESLTKTFSQFNKAIVSDSRRFVRFCYLLLRKRDEFLEIF
jgi:hypothetical protein